MAFISGVQRVSYLNKQQKQIDGYRFYISDVFSERDVNLGSVGTQCDVAFFNVRDIDFELVDFIKSEVAGGSAPSVEVVYNKYGRPVKLICSDYTAFKQLHS